MSLRAGTLVLAFWALGVLPASAPLAQQGPQAASPGHFEWELARLAAERPGEPFDPSGLPPEPFRTCLEKGRGSRGRRSRPLTNQEALSVVRSCRPVAELAGPSGLRPAAVPEAPRRGLRAPGAGPEVPDPAGKAPRPPEAKKTADLEGAPAPRPEETGRIGPRIFGIDLGSGHETDRDENDPYLNKGFGQVFDWDIRAKVRLDALGARASYRHPRPLRGFSLGFRYYLDVPRTLQLDEPRDRVYKSLGADPPGKTSGFGLYGTAVINEHWGLAAEFDRKEETREDPGDFRRKYRRVASVSGGYSPLGENKGKPWNYTLLASLNHQRLESDQPGFGEDREGFGWSAGVALQRAIRSLPIPVLNPRGTREGLWVERIKTKVSFADSAVSSLSFDAVVGVTVFVSRHLEIFLGGGARWFRSPRPPEGAVEPRGDFGLDLHF